MDIRLPNLDGGRLMVLGINIQRTFVDHLLRVISEHEVQLFAAFIGMQVALICVGNEFPFLCLSQRDWTFGKPCSADQDKRKSVGVLPMSRGFVLILACCASLFSFSVQASPILLPMQKTAPDITLVRGFCGLGFHRGPYGYCMRNGTVPVPPVVVAPSPVVVAPSPVIVAPSPVVVAPAVPVVVAPMVCPYGYYLGPYGRCLLNYY